MPRRYPRGRRRRPGRRPPYRYTGGHGPPGGFTAPGMKPFYDVFMPGLRGAEKREFFNGVSRWIVASFAVGGGAIGYSWLGLFGALLGLGAGLMAGGWFAESQRFYRR